MKEKIILIVKGFIMGIANIIPGVSGGTLAMTLGIYEQFISSISHFFEKIKENLSFLLPILLGIGLALVSMSRVIDFSYQNYPLPTTLFFIGLVLGGVPMIYKKIQGKENRKVSNIIIFLITFSLVIFMALAGRIFEGMGDVDLHHLNFLGYILLFIVGMIAAGTMVIPGVSGSLMLMLLGYYYPIIALIKELTAFHDLFSNLLVAGVFGIGVVVGFIGISKLIEFLFQKHEKKFYFGVFGFILASAPAIILSALEEVTFILNPVQVLLAIVFFGLGIFISYMLGEK